MNVSNWICSNCKLTNCILNRRCADRECGNKRPYELSANETQQILAVLRGSSHTTKRFDLYDGVTLMATERNEELHAKYFNHEQTVIANMDMGQLDEHCQELELIIFEARVRHQTAAQKKREMIALLSKEQREALITRPDFNSSERSKLPARDKRRTAADKAIDMLKAIGGIDLSDIEALTKNLQKSATPVVAKAAVSAEQGRPTFNKAITAEVVTIDGKTAFVPATADTKYPVTVSEDVIVSRSVVEPVIAEPLCLCGETASKHIPFVGVIGGKCKSFTAA